MKYFFRWIPLLLAICISTGAFAQQPGYASPSKTQFVVAIDRILEENLVNVFPHHHCYCNNCRHTYTGSLRLGKMQHTMRLIPMPNGLEKRDPIIRVWGKAQTEQKTQFMGSTAYIYFIADIKEYPDGLEVISLKWKLDDCMRYKLLVGGEDELKPQYEEEEEPATAENEEYIEEEPVEEAPAPVEIAQSKNLPDPEPQDSPESRQADRAAMVDTSAVIPFTEEAKDPIAKQVLKTESDMELLPQSKKEVKMGMRPVWKVEGHITNQSDLQFKDAVIEIAFFTKTHTLLATERHVIYEFLDPGSKQSFSYEVRPPEATSFHVVTLVEAVRIKD